MIVTIDGIPVYDATIDALDQGMFRISLVDDPAVMSNFQTFDRARKVQMYAVQDEEKRLVYGCVMRADFPIFRYDPEMGEYYVIYKADTIRQMAEKYLLESRQNDVNTMHEQGSDVDGVQMVQWFIKDAAKGIAPSGFDDIADGSLFAEFHVTNDEVWNEIKEGTYKGFSLEGIFTLKPEQRVDEVKDIVDALAGAFERLTNHTEKNMSKLSRLKARLAKALQEFGNITTDKGILAWDGEDDIEVGVSVFIEDEQGNQTPAEDGDYKTDEGKVIVVAEGKVSEIKDAEPVVDEPEPVAEEAPVAMGAVSTDRGELHWEGEEDLKEGDEVFVEREGERLPAEDGEYTTEDGKVIVVVESKVAEIRDARAEVAPEPSAEEEALRRENESLKAELAELKAKVEKMEKMSAAKPAHKEMGSSAAGQTGIKGLDNLARIMSAK